MVFEYPIVHANWLSDGKLDIFICIIRIAQAGACVCEVMVNRIKFFPAPPPKKGCQFVCACLCLSQKPCLSYARQAGNHQSLTDWLTGRLTASKVKTVNCVHSRTKSTRRSHPMKSSHARLTKHSPLQSDTHTHTPGSLMQATSTTKSERLRQSWQLSKQLLIYASADLLWTNMTLDSRLRERPGVKGGICCHLVDGANSGLERRGAQGWTTGLQDSGHITVFLQSLLQFFQSF